jgi:hypothetical protein
LRPPKARNLDSEDQGVDFASRHIGITHSIGGNGPRIVAAAYDAHLFWGAGLQDLPDSPRFTFMATNLRTGRERRIANVYAANFRVGRIGRPTFSLARGPRIGDIEDGCAMSHRA